MAPKKNVAAMNHKKNELATIEAKKELMAKCESGTHVSYYPAIFGLPKATVSTILQHKEVMNVVDEAKDVLRFLGESTLK